MYRIYKFYLFAFTALFLLAGANTAAQTKYWVFFKDKAGAEATFNPHTFFDATALQRRINNGVPLFDFTDVPVAEEYISEVSKLADSMGQSSRWFNAVGVWATETHIRLIEKMPFVLRAEPMQVQLQTAEFVNLLNSYDEEYKIDELELIELQTERLQASLFRAAKIDGKGIRIAVMDVGFKGVDKHEAFRHLRDENRILFTRDFIKKKDFVYGYGTHGTMVLSCIAGLYKDSIPMGMATGASFMLARTERGLTEWKDEEDNWVAAAEWADKNGAHIINSSLGYSHKRYFYRDMDGKTSYVAKGANMAARKGILVVTAAGNDGNSNWKFICTPADADSALTIGGTDPRSNYHISFSSFGPTADERLKPNVAAPGRAYVATPKGYSQSFGTSFSTPITAGFAACVLQQNPQMKTMKLFSEIEKSGSLYPYFDYAHGYGIPQASYFIGSKVQPKRELPTITIEKNRYAITVDANARYFNEEGPVAELREKKLYYQVWDAQDKLIKYYVVEVQEQRVLTLNVDDLPPGGKVRFHFDGFTTETEL